jgi:hypothetical protein
MSKQLASEVGRRELPLGEAHFQILDYIFEHVERHQRWPTCQQVADLGRTVMRTKIPEWPQAVHRLVEDLRDHGHVADDGSRAGIRALKDRDGRLVILKLARSPR